MALSFFGFTCDAVRDEPSLVLVRFDDIETFIYTPRVRARRARVSCDQEYQERAKRASWTRGIVVPRKRAASICLDLLRRGVKPWADPRRRRAA